MEAALRAPILAAPSGKSVSMTETTLSFAMKPLIREVTMRQSPRPTGRMTGTSSPETAARMLSWEFSTRLKLKSKLFRNHTTMVAIRMTEKAR